MTTDHFPSQLLLQQERFFITSTREGIKIICHYPVTAIMWCDWWYADMFFFPVLWAVMRCPNNSCYCCFACFEISDARSQTLVTVNKRFCMQMIKTNSFKSHQRPSELRWSRSQAAASVKCLANKNTVHFLHINGYSVVRYREPPSTVTAWLISESICWFKYGLWALM